RISFSHVYFNPDRRGAAVEIDARRTLAEIQAMDPPPKRLPEAGDRFMLPYDYTLLTPLEVQQQFGSRFADALLELEPGWHGPIVSGYGLHLVNVRERADSRIPEYGEIRDRLVTDYNRMRSDRAKNALYESLAAEYDVEIDEEALDSAALRSSQATRSQ
ncbi:MAG: peptidylprolyl isomerase, partial [Gemmatimonadales bacterium]